MNYRMTFLVMAALLASACGGVEEAAPSEVDGELAAQALVTEYTVRAGDTYYGLAERWLRQNQPSEAAFGGSVLVIAHQLRAWDPTPGVLTVGERLKLDSDRLFALLRLIGEGQRYYEIFYPQGWEPTTPEPGAIALHGAALVRLGWKLHCPSDPRSLCYVARVNDSVYSISQDIADRLIVELVLNPACFRDATEDVRQTLLSAKAFGADERVWAEEAVKIPSFSTAAQKSRLRERFASGGSYRCAKQSH